MVGTIAQNHWQTDNAVVMSQCYKCL